MLSCMEYWVTPREEFFELFLVKVDDQVFDGDGFNTLTVALQHRLLVAEENLCPSGLAILFSIKIDWWKTYQKELRSEITGNFLKKRKGKLQVDLL